KGGDSMKLSQIIREVIVMARALRKARESEDINDDSPMIYNGGSSKMRTPLAEGVRVGDYLERFPAKGVDMIMAIVRFVIEDFTTKEELVERYVEVSETYGIPGLVVKYLLNSMFLAEHLEEGLEKLARIGIDTDELIENERSLSRA